MATWTDVRRIARTLPELVEETSFDRPAWKVKKKLVIWDRPLRKADLKALGPAAPDGPILGVRTADLEMKEMLLARDPSVYFTTPHFDGYPAVLVQLQRIDLDELKDVITDAWFSTATPTDRERSRAVRKPSRRAGSRTTD